MPRISAEAPELIASPDGAWVAALADGSLSLYSLDGGAEVALVDASEKSADPEDELPSLCQAQCSVEKGGTGGRISFVGPDRLLHVFVEQPRQDGDAETGLIAAELLTVPDLRPIGPLVRVGGAQRIVGVGPSGAVVAPLGVGADILCLRGNELTLQRTFMRSEVRSAVPAPERRFLLEQRGGFEVWDPISRTTVTRLVLQTRQPAMQIGYAQSGRMLWALSAGPPIHLEIFRASDGRRVMETDQPGRGIAAESAPGRLLLAAEERGGKVFLDIDLITGALHRYVMPSTYGALTCFAVRPRAGAPEVLALTEHGTDASGGGLLRLRLPVIQQTPARTGADDPASGGGVGSARPSGRPAVAVPVQGPGDPVGGLAGMARGRGTRPDGRVDARGDGRPDGRSENRSDARPEGRLDGRAGRTSPFLDDRAARSQSVLAQASAVMLSDDQPSATLTSATVDDPVDSVLESDGVLIRGNSATPPPTPGGNRRRKRYDDMLRRTYDPAQGAAAWQWELMRWAQLALSAAEDHMPLPPEGGALQPLASRLRLTPAAQKILGLLYACEYLLGVRPRGMRMMEIAASLSSLYEEPTLLSELLPASPLRVLGLIEVHRDGRLRLMGELGRMLVGLPCPDLIATAGADRDALPVGLYGYHGPFTRASTLLLRQPVLRVDALSDPQPLVTLRRALQRALVYDAVVVIDGLAGLSFPAFSSASVLPALRPLLTSVRVPVVLCSMPDTLAVTGLSARPLPSGLLINNTLASAPLIPSAPLPTGTTWRGPMLPVSAAFVDGGTQIGRLEPVTPGDRRSAVVIGPSATPEAYAMAAYIAARDGSVLLLDVELTSVRALVLAMLLRQIPIVVTATPPATPGVAGAPAWPNILLPFVA